MRGGLERWKRGVGSQGVRQALAYAFQGSCDSHVRATSGVDALAGYSAVAADGVTRFTVNDGVIATDSLDEPALRRWVDGCDPRTGERRGRDLTSPDSDLILDGTINAPKSYSIAALVNPELAVEFEALQDRLRDQIITMWQRELNARRGAGGHIREALQRIEVVELKHRRSRALDPHIHRHLWLNVKVLGRDGKWSNIDSRVAMKMHTLINAEGELAARTDPEWIHALARNGFTLNTEGEIAELANAVRPLSRRSTQIEANRAMLLAAWRVENPGQEPGPDQLHRIDRLAWSKARPNKPGEVDERAWEQLIRDELKAIDPKLLMGRMPVSPPATNVDTLDWDLLVAKAVVEADARSAACGGRFSLFDVRAGATRALAASGIVAPRAHLQQVIDDVTNGALELTIDLLDGEGARPSHIKGFMAAATAALKLDLAAQFDALAIAGEPLSNDAVVHAAARVLHNDIVLDDRQLCAAAAIAGTDRLISITGPAGAGKTTMLRVARAALGNRGGRMIVVAPTKKAASVAGREIGSAASSLHALLADHGWRWTRDKAGAEHWSHLRPGDADPTTGAVYLGPRRFPLQAGDRIVIDEAGMVDLHAAHALAAVAAETAAGVAMVGDHLQARPVGHSGAMAMLTRRATAVVELTAVHRFGDPAYAALTLRMREPASKDHAVAVASELHERGLIRRVVDHATAHDAMVEAFFTWAGQRRRIALVTGTNEEADAINEAIQQRRLDDGQLRSDRIAVGQGEQRLLEGDIVQTRRNDRQSDVENRALWTIRHITTDRLELTSLGDSADTRTVTAEYAAEFVHLAYASTVHGIQGETTDASVVGPGVDASGLYVGMTRGRIHNEAIAIARTDAAAREQVAGSMLRGIPEVSIDDSIRAARTELGRAARDVDETLSMPDAGGQPTATANEMRGRLSRSRTWLQDAKNDLLALDASIAADAARGHAQAAGGLSSKSIAARDELARRYADELTEYTAMTHAYRESVRSDTGPSNAQSRLDRVPAVSADPHPGAHAAAPQSAGLAR